MNKQMHKEYTDQEANSKLLKGIIIGGIIGGALTLFDSTTRSKVKKAASGMTASSKEMLVNVKENPQETKNQMIDRFKTASTTLKDAINDAQDLYAKFNEDVFSKVEEVKDISSDAVSTVKDSKEDIKEVGSKVAKAGSQAAEAYPKASENKTMSGNVDNLPEKQASPELKPVETGTSRPNQM